MIFSSGLSLMLLVLNVCFAIDSDIREEDLGNKISLKVPQLSEEENRSNHMPTNLRCDACLAVVYQLYTALFVEQSKLDKSKKRKSLKEYEILETIENVCNKNFEEYGVKQVDGLNRLSGPGLETQGVMGMTQMGGRWPHRLQEMCHYYIGEAGEFDIYEMFLEGKSKLTEFLCYGKGTYGHCAQLKSSTKTEL